MSTIMFKKFSSSWDKGRKRERIKLLTEFVKTYVTNSEKTIDLERDFGGAAALVFNRFMSNLRLSYVLEKNIALQLQAISVFLLYSSDFTRRFIYLGTGNVLLEILRLKKASENDKRAAVKLFKILAKSGSEGKAHIEEIDLLSVVLEFMASSKDESTSLVIQDFLLEMTNFCDLKQLHKLLISLIQREEFRPFQKRLCLQILCRTLKLFQPGDIKKILDLLEVDDLQLTHEVNTLLSRLDVFRSLIVFHLMRLIDKAENSEERWKSNDIYTNCLRTITGNNIVFAEEACKQMSKLTSMSKKTCASIERCLAAVKQNQEPVDKFEIVSPEDKKKFKRESETKRKFSRPGRLKRAHTFSMIIVPARTSSEELDVNEIALPSLSVTREEPETDSSRGTRRSRDAWEISTSEEEETNAAIAGLLRETPSTTFEEDEEPEDETPIFSRRKKAPNLKRDIYMPYSNLRDLELEFTQLPTDSQKQPIDSMLGHMIHRDRNTPFQCNKEQEDEAAKQEALGNSRSLPKLKRIF